MASLTSNSETLLRLLAFAGVFAVMALLELIIPKRNLSVAKRPRWLTNLSIIGLGALLVRLMDLFPRFIGGLLMPLSAVATAMWAEARGVGLLHLVSWPAWIEIVLAVVVLDFALWLQHLASHKIGPLWAVHRMHHADRDIDVTTALRFHPVELAVSMLWKMAWVVVLGPTPVAVMLFEVILNGCAMFNHANVAFPRWLDRTLRTVLVTPDMHRVHHSIVRRELDSNYGFNLSLWDRLFSTYVAEPERGHDDMTIGLAQYQDERPTRLGWNLSMPFRRGK